LERLYRFFWHDACAESAAARAAMMGRKQNYWILETALRSMTLSCFVESAAVAK
jgi:hypothetical protein